MQLIGSRGQQQIDELYDASGTITAGGTPQLVLPQSKTRSLLVLENLSAENLIFQIGVRPATAVLTNGVVTSVTVNDAGFGFQLPADVLFLGGGNAGNAFSDGGTMPDWPAPNRPATGHAIMGSSAISGLQINSIGIYDGGAGYLAPPFVHIRANQNDPTGVGIPSASTGILLVPAGGSASFDATMCPTSAVSVFGSVTGQAFTCKWAVS